MSGQAQRLQELLTRVQENRGQPRDGQSSQPMSIEPEVIESAPPPEPDDPFMSAPPVPPAAPQRHAPTPHPAAPPGTPLATPLEMAIEDQVVRASREPAQPQAPIEGRVVADPAPMAASRSIAQATTKHPPLTGQTFGDLLRRSLSLRPR